MQISTALADRDKLVSPAMALSGGQHLQARAPAHAQAQAQAPGYANGLMHPDMVHGALFKVVLQQLGEYC